jgi:hypothetical protein
VTGAERSGSSRSWRMLRTGYARRCAVAMLALATVAAGGAAGAGRATPASTRIQVTATVLPRASLKILHQETMLTLTVDDVLRGFLDAPAATRVEVHENSPQGYLLVVEELGAPESPVERVTLRGLGADVEVGRGGGLIARPHVRGTVTAELSYRFMLTRNARAGIYPWPLSLSVRPR